MSHGNSGIAWALASAGSLLKDKSLLMLARTVVNSEDYYYDRKKKNWPDFRADSSDMKSWCHGAPGIVLARYLLSKINPTLFPIEPYEEILNELSKIESKAGNTCCGLAGISDILITTSNDKNKNLEDAERILLSIIDESSCSYGFRTVANRENGIVSTSLMQGELGIAHTLLRHYSAQNGRPLGSFLSLE
jgi:lantibiotic modifying enzyme